LEGGTLYKGRDNFLYVIGCAGLLVFSLLFLTPLFGSASASPLAEAQAPNKPGSKTIYLPFMRNGAPKAPASEWLQLLNSYRDLAGLPPVDENVAWSAGDVNHARYVVKNDVVTHSEDANNPWYTPEGHAAAQSGNLMGSSNLNTSDLNAIEAWMQAPFHALGILDPSLLEVGFGSYRESDGGLQMGAGLDVLRGRGGDRAGMNYPVLWPGAGTTVGIGSHYGEYPNPLSSCPGYSTPSGLPILVQIGSGDQTPRVGTHDFRQGSTSLEHCIITETSYANPDGAAQALGQSILDGRDAIVIIPRQPLSPGATYTVSIDVNGQMITWSFHMASKLKAAVTDASLVTFR
jgi:uncharacterized protein YkwD